MNDIHSILQTGPTFQAPCLLTDPIHMILEVSLPGIQDLVRGFREDPCPESFLRLEEALQKELADTGSNMLATVVGSLHRDREFVAGSVAATRATAGQQFRTQGLRTTTVRFLGGAEIPFTTPYLSRDLQGRPGRRRGVGRRGENGEGCYPVLEALGIHHQATPALASEVARQCVRCGSFEEASEALRERGISLDAKGARTLALFVGEEALRQREARKQAAEAGAAFSEEFAGKRIVVSTDGGRLRTREGGKRGRRGKKGRRRYRTPWREPKLVIAYVIDENGRKLRSSRPFYDGTLEDAATAFDLLIGELLLRGAAKAKEIVLTGDGALWIWNRADALARALGLPPDRIVRVADFYHAVEHLTAIADLRTTWGDQNRKMWVSTMRRRLKRGKIDLIISERVSRRSLGSTSRPSARRSGYGYVWSAKKSQTMSGPLKPSGFRSARRGPIGQWWRSPARSRYSSVFPAVFPGAGASKR